MQVPLLDLKAQFAVYKEAAMAQIEEVAEAQHFINGPKVVKAERELAEYCGVPYAVGVSSGSDALLIALMAEEIGPGDEVICPPFTFFATAGAIHRVGATPVFCDVDEQTFNICPEKVRAAVTPQTKAIIPVHLFGQMADMDPILKIAQKYGLIVIEDGAQAIGSEYKNNRAGSLGDYACFSFFPSKNLGAFGDGGLVVTQDEDKYKKLKCLRNHGSEIKYYNDFVGGNFRLDAIQAAIVSCKLPYLDSWHKKRAENAAVYTEKFSEAGLLDKVLLPFVAPSSSRHIYNQFTLTVVDGRRDELQKGLKDLGIGCEIYYPKVLSLQKCFKHLGHKEGDFPVSERLSQSVLSVPIYPELSLEQQDAVVVAIQKILG